MRGPLTHSPYPRRHRVRVLGLLFSWLLCSTGCDAPAPVVVEVAYPQDRTGDTLGPYRVTAITAGSATEVMIRWSVADGAGLPPQPFEASPMAEARTDHWVGHLPGAPAGAVVHLYLEATGPGGSSRTSAQRFRVLPEDGVCRVDSDCGPEQICDRLENRCHTPPAVCADDGDCAQDYVCVGGACRLRGAGCVDDAQCPAGLVCRDGQCLPPPECGDDEDCPDGVCVPPGRCVEEGPCTPGDPGCPEEACGLDEYEPNDALDEMVLGTVSVGSPVQGSLCPTDVDYFVFFPPGDRVVINADGVVRAETFGPGGEPLEARDGGPSGTIILPAPPGGGFIRLATDAEAADYRVEVPEVAPSACGMDVFEPNGGPDEATTLGGNGADLQGRICSDDTDWYYIRRRPENAPGRVSLVPLDEAQLEWRLQDDSDQVYAQGGGTAPMGFEYQGFEGPLYFVVSCPECSEDVRYRVTTDTSMMTCEDDALAPNHDPDRPVSIPARADIVDLVACAGADDYFEFEKDRDVEVGITITYPAFGGDLVAEVVARRGRYRSEVVGEDGRIELLVPDRANDGGYLLRIGLLGSGSNTYELQIESR